MSKTVALVEMKSHFSDYISKSAYNHERFIITKRNKPVAALVAIEDLQVIEQAEERQGLASVVGKWKCFNEISDAFKDLSEMRKSGGSGRDVSF